MNRPLSLGISLSVIATFAAIILLWFLPSQRVPTVVSLTAGVPLTLFTTFIVYLLQSPDFAATIQPSETKGKLPGQRPDVATTRWVHVLVRNLSIGFLGGGTAANVGGVISLTRGMEVREFRPKWETKPNPLSVNQFVVRGETVINVVTDETQMEAAKRETLEPGEVKSLDIAFKTRGDAACYISIPENFRYPGLRNEAAAYPPGTYSFDLFIEYKRRRRKAGTFLLHNEEGAEPENLWLELAESRSVKT